MSVAAAPVRFQSVWGVPAMRGARLPAALIVALLVGQLALIFVKSFNWDEYLHVEMVYQLREGTLARPLQTFLARLLFWVPDVSDNFFEQMIVARLVAWAAFVAGLAAIYGTARQFVSRENAAWAVLGYLAAGNVFLHGFAIRTDPIAMAMLMLALWCLASQRLGWIISIVSGVLIGVAGLLTVKAVFFAPCFAGIAWLRLSQCEDRRAVLLRIGAVIPIAVVAFAAMSLLHRSGLAHPGDTAVQSASIAHLMTWLDQGLLPRPRDTLIGFATAPLLLLALVKAPVDWCRQPFDRNRALVLASLCLPLASVLFYRNVFPYFFVFILAPVAVGVAPTIGALREQIGRVPVALLLVIVPLIAFTSEPHDVMHRQRTVVDYVDRQLSPGKTYLDYSGMAFAHHRVVDHLLSGIGLASYRARGVPLIAQAVARGELALVVENHRNISRALAGETTADGLLPQDVAALHANFVQVGLKVWLAGKSIPAGQEPARIVIPATGNFTAHSPVFVDGNRLGRGEIVRLAVGPHLVTGHRSEPTVLWRGDHIPSAPPAEPPGLLFTRF